MTVENVLSGNFRGIRYVRGIAWLTMSISVIIICLNLPSDQNFLNSYLQNLAFFSIAFIYIMKHINTRIHKSLLDAEKDSVYWKKCRTFWIILTTFLFVASILEFVNIIIGPENLRTRSLTLGDLILIVLFFSNIYIILKINRISQEVHEGKSPDYFIKDFPYVVASVIAAITTIQVLKNSIEDSVAPLLTTLALISAGTGGLANFTMSYARGLKNAGHAEKTHEVGGWMLRQAITLTVSGISILPGVLNFAFVRDWIIEILYMLDNFNWVRQAYPNLITFLYKQHFTGYKSDELTNIVSLALIFLTLFSVYTFINALVNVVINLGQIYSWLKEIGNDFEPSSLTTDDLKENK